MVFTEVPVLHVKCQLCAPLLAHTSGVEGSTFTEGVNVFVFDTDKATLSADKTRSYKTHNPTFSGSTFRIEGSNLFVQLQSFYSTIDSACDLWGSRV